MASAGLPPSPSWRSVLHPNRHLGRSNQYRYREEPDRHDQHPNVAFASSLHYNGTGGDLAVGGDTTGVGANQWPTLIVPLNQMSFWRRHEEQQQSHTDKSPSSEVFPFGVARSNVTATATAARWSNSSSVHHQTTKQSSPPFLTLALVKLTEVLPIYFQHLANPTIANASKACAVLDGIVATASSPTNSPKRTVHQPERSKQKNQNKNTKNSHERRRRMATAITLANNPTSPLTLQYWMSSSSSLASSKQFQQQTPTAMALESEWEALIAPFILLVAAETMAADLEHLRAAADMLPNMDDDPKNIISITATMTMSQNEPSNSATSASILGGLYQLVNRDLMHLHDILCEPFLRVSSNDKNSGTSRSGDPLHLHTEAALLLASGLKLAMEIGNVRCQLIDLQAGIFGLSKSISADPLLPLILNHTQDVTAIERDRPTLSEAATAVTLFIQAIEQAATVSTPDDETGLHNGSTSPTPNGRCKVQSLLQPMTKALIEELQAWKYCFATCAALERCDFPETILSIRLWKMRCTSTESSNGTRMMRWMQRSLQATLSLLPIYFDRIHAFATPLYGFDTAALWREPSQQSSSRSLSATSNNALYYNRVDWDSAITEFLRRQDKLGGPMAAVALVLDARSTSNFHVERGFRFASDNDSKHDDDTRASWPAIYLRSTCHLPSTTSSVRSSPHTSAVFRSSQSSILSSWSSGYGGSAGGGSSSPFGAGSRKHPISIASPLSSNRKSTNSSNPLQQHHYSVLEYAPDTGAANSWPHSDWDSLVATLLNETLRGTTLSPSRNGASTAAKNTSLDEDNDDNSDTNSEEELQRSIPHLAPFALDRVTCGIRKTHGQKSTFYSIVLGEFITLVIAVKDKEADSRWHRRQNGLDDAEIQAFVMGVLVPNLGVMSFFSSANRTALLNMDLSEKRVTIPCENESQWENDQNVQKFLTTVKGIFGLRRATSLAIGSNNRALSFYGNATPRTPLNRQTLVGSRGKRNRQAPFDTALSESAADFFLGPDLASCLG